MNGHSWELLAVIFAVTYSLRALPFVVFRAKKGLTAERGCEGRGVSRSGELRESGERDSRLHQVATLMPLGIMIVLVAYSYRGEFAEGGAPVSGAIGIAITAALHLWKRNAMVSIVGGVAAYGLLTHFLA